MNNEMQLTIAGFMLWADLRFVDSGFSEPTEFGVDDAGRVFARNGYVTMRASRDFSWAMFESPYYPRKKINLAGALT